MRNFRFGSVLTFAAWISALFAPANLLLNTSMRSTAIVSLHLAGWDL
jgi:hypothetical protein